MLDRHRSFAVAALLFLLIAYTSCSSPQAIATFAGSAEQALNEGPPLFQDLYGSCSRIHLYRQPIEPVFTGKLAVQESASKPQVSACSNFQTEADSLATDSAVLSAYFKAMQELASFNTTAVTGPSTAATTQAATTANLTASQVQAVGKLAGLVAQASSEHYQRSRLARCLREADSSVTEAAQAFEKVARDYEGMLEEERRELRARYQDADASKQPAIVLLLNRAYAEDMKELDSRRQAAGAYISALEQVSQGHHELAATAGKLKPKEVGVALEPYTAKLRQLVPAMQRAFR